MCCFFLLFYCYWIIRRTLHEFIALVVEMIFCFTFSPKCVILRRVNESNPLMTSFIEAEYLERFPVVNCEHIKEDSSVLVQQFR